MRICFIADTNSPTTHSLVSLFAGTCEVRLIDPRQPGRMRTVSTQADTNVVGPARDVRPDRRGLIVHRLAVAAPNVASYVADACYRVRSRHAQAWIQEALDSFDADIVHALRIPFEGIIASRVRTTARLVLSVWGNDFTLHAAAASWVRSATMRSLERADALVADCSRDLGLARKQFGYPAHRPALVVAGGGGVDRATFPLNSERRPGTLIVNPRGVRTYVRTETFVRAMPYVLAEFPQARFAAVGVRGYTQFRSLAGRLGVSAAFEALPQASQSEMATLLQSAAVSVSPSEHDGTPNTLLEAMACGAIPVAGDIESIREWITDRDNGCLCDPRSPEDVAGAILHVLRHPEWADDARQRNARLVAARADRDASRDTLLRLYESLLTSPREACA